MKKALVILLSLLMCAGVLAFPAYTAESTHNINAINMGRGENQLIVFTPDFGASTATNQWGIEAVVGADNKIIRVTKTGNEAIPEGGFIVSAHGTAVSWVSDNCKAGKYCYYDSRSMTVVVSDTPVEVGGMFYTIEHTFTNLNTTREQDNIIIYTNAGTNTKTNDWGTEVVVGSDGRVTNVGGNNKKVPSGGYVVSGHGTGSDWLNANVAIGMKASYDASKKTVTFVMDAEAYILGFDLSIKELEDKISDGKKNLLYYNYERAEAMLSKAKAERDGYSALADDKAREASIAVIERSLREGIAACSESRTVEYRGVWIRPTQTTQAEVAAYVERLYNAGLNTLCIETLYDSTLICPPPKGSDFEQNPRLGGFDVLKAYVEECHKRDMELHIWMPVFYSSHTTCKNNKRSVWYKNPEWRLINDSGKDVAVKNPSFDFCFLNPALPEVREMLIDTYEYLVTEYDVDGFELDYIRYPDRTADDHGYDRYTMDGFKEKYGLKTDPQHNDKASYWNNWVQYRCDIISSFVGEVREMFDESAPNVLLCADVGENPESSKKSIYQDYSVWLENGWIDLLKPMSYTLDAVTRTDENVKKANGKLVAAGIGVFSEAYGGYDCALHTIIANSLGSDGVMFFEANAYLAKNTADYLTEFGAYRNRAITPTLNPDKAVELALQYASDRIESVILKYGDIDKNTHADVNQLAKKAADGGVTVDDIQQVIDGMGDNASCKALKRDLEYAIKIINNTDGKDAKPTPPETSDETEVSEVPDESAVNDESGVADESEAPEANSSDTDSSDATGKTSPWIWIAVGVAAAALAVVISAIVKKKK